MRRRRDELHVRGFPAATPRQRTVREDPRRRAAGSPRERGDLLPASRPRRSFGLPPWLRGGRFLPRIGGPGHGSSTARAGRTATPVAPLRSGLVHPQPRSGAWSDQSTTVGSSPGVRGVRGCLVGGLAGSWLNPVGGVVHAPTLALLTCRRATPCWRVCGSARRSARVWRRSFVLPQRQPAVVLLAWVARVEPVGLDRRAR